jgi:hypothetical protein
MRIKVGETIMIGGKKRTVVEIQCDMFDRRQDIVCFDDKTKMVITEVKEDNLHIRLCDYPYNHNFDHMYSHHFGGWGEDRYYMVDKAHWIYNKLTRGWKSVVNLNHVYLDGMIAKKDLVEGAIYLGHCRNAGYAQWQGDKFEYIRHKFGCEYMEEIDHPEDDKGYDIFVPILKTEYKVLTDCPL